MKKLISVIIPAKNRVEFTREAIESVLAQKVTKDIRIEIIVVDNRSEPSLKSQLGSDYPSVNFRLNTRFDSPGGTRNVGLISCKGDYVAFLDNDDTWKKDFLVKSIESLESNKTAATLTLTSPYFFGSYPNGKRLTLIFLNFIRTVSLSAIHYLAGNKLPLSAFYLAQISHMLFDRKEIGSVRFRERTAAAEDWEFISRVMFKKGIAIIPEKLVNFRYEMRSNTNTDKVKREKWNAYLKLLNRLGFEYKTFPWYQLFLRYIGIFS